jgi:zinc resistance-associated protein
MKRITMLIVVVAVAIVAASVAFAQMGSGPGMDGRGSYGSGTDSQVNIENLKKFQKDTLSLRDDLMVKRAELQNEYLKQTPDTARIAEIQKQMIDLQAKIQTAAQKNGLPAWGQGYGRGRMGRGMMAGNGPCGSGCPGWGQR